MLSSPPRHHRLMLPYACGLKDGLDALVGDAIADPLTLLAADDQSYISQQLHSCCEM